MAHSVSSPRLETQDDQARESGAAAPRDILSSIGETVYDWDMISDRIAWGPNVCDILQVAEPAQLATGRGFAAMLSLDSATTRFEAISRAIDADNGDGARYQAQYGVLLDPDSRNSQTVLIEDTGRCFAGPDGRAVRAHGAIRVLARGADALQAHQANQNRGAESRAVLTEAAQRLFADTRPGKSNFSLLLLAIDGLSKINRASGYTSGDAVITEVLARIRKRMRTKDILARYAGNRFAILLQNCDQEQLRAAAQRFLDICTAEPIEAGGHGHYIVMRSGGVTAPRDARNVQQLFQHAEEAIDAAQAQGERFTAYTQSLAKDYEQLRNQAIAEHILDAINQRRIHIALQPIVDTRTGAPAFYEALLRLQLDDGRVLAPESIIPVAEKAGLIANIDQRIMELAIDRLVADPSLTISINVSGISAMDSGWLSALRGKLALAPGAAGRLIAEITETVAISDLDAMRSRIHDIRQTGIRIAMDDFGAGYTSFRNLRGLGIDLLKIDGAFVQNLTRSPDDRFFVRTLVDLARHLQIPVVAEWVESRETASLLAEWGVDYCQGSWYGMGVCEELESNAAPSAAKPQLREGVPDAA